MNSFPVKATLLAALAGMLVAYAIDIAINLTLMSADYAALGAVWRSPEELQSRLWLGLVIYLLYYGLFASLFARLYVVAAPDAEAALACTGRLGRGCAYGLFMALLFSVPSALMQYVYYPIPFSLAAKWIASGFVVHAASGAVVAAILLPRGK